MKVAILTQPLRKNYGGIIQNYALQKVLIGLGIQPLTINRKHNQTLSNFDIFKNKHKSWISKYILRRSKITYWQEKKLFTNNERFLKQHINLSEAIDSDSRMRSYFDNHKFDAIIVGSDQTWRPRYSPNIYNFYLDALIHDEQTKKIAYASSFGTEKWEYTEEQTRRCRELIKKFDAVSVREESGVKLCKKYFNTEAIHLLDPTLLLSQEDYSQLIHQPIEDKGLFSYVLDTSEEKTTFIQNVADTMRLKPTRSQAESLDENIRRNWKEYIAPPIEQWLQGFRDAQFVITDSFHGTVFSIINGKPFVSLVNKRRGASRFESLLRQLELEDRLVYDINQFDFDLLKRNINYKKVEAKLNELKTQSLEFLISNL